MSPDKRFLPKKSSKIDKHTTDIDGKVYDVYKLVVEAESLPVEMVSISSLLGFLKGNKCWKDSNGDMFGPEDVKKVVGHSLNWDQMKADYPAFVKHIAKIEEANLAHPLLILGEKRIIDGMHRITKAWLEEVEEIPIKRFQAVPDSALLK